MAKEYYSKCSEGIEQTNLSKDVTQLHKRINMNIDIVFKCLNNQIQSFGRKAKGIELLEDLKKLHESNQEMILDEWKVIFFKN